MTRAGTHSRPLLTPPERRALLRVARDAIGARLQGRESPPMPVAGRLADPAAVFVTLRHAGTLRGCVGSMEPVRALAEAVAQSAQSSACDDPRFDRMAAHELDSMSIEVSVLGDLEPIAGPADISVGRHGLVVESPLGRGLLLPQVAVEHDWNAATFLAQTCVKAGLPPDAWRADARMFRFEAEVFGDGGVRAG